jgi:hypothetical protein
LGSAKRASLILLMMVVVCGVQARQASQEPATKSDSGKVVSVDAAKNELKVKDDKGAEKTITVTASTKITKGGKDVTLADLKAGDRVMYELDASASTPVAKMLMIMTGKPE